MAGGGIFLCSRRFLISLLLVSLIVTSLRQVFDVIGRMWLPILVNFIHILFVIFGIFGAWQFRPGFLIVSSFWMPFYLSWNVFLGCFFMNFETLDRDSAILSLGHSFSRSFWAERMPFCRNSYDLTEKRWIQPENCLVPYYYAEVSYSIMCFVVAFLAFTFALVYMCSFSRQAIAHSYTMKKRQKMAKKAPKTPNLTIERDQNGQIVNLDPKGLDTKGRAKRRESYDSQTTGYLNTSFESDVTASKKFQPQLDPKGNLVQHYNKSKRASSKRRKVKKIDSSNQSIMPIENNQSNATPISREEIAYEQNRAIRARSQSTGRNKDNAQSERSRARSVSPIRSTPTLGSSPDIEVHPYDEQPSLSAHIKLDTSTGNLMFDPSSESSQHAIMGRDHHHVGHTTPDALHKQHRGSKSNLSLQDYGASRRLSVTEPRGIRNSNDSVLNGHSDRAPQSRLNNLTRRSAHNIHVHDRHTPRNGPVRHQNQIQTPNQSATLMGFDPKSNTLIRYQNQAPEQYPITDQSIPDNRSQSINNSSVDSCISKSSGTNNYQRIAIPPDPVPSLAIVHPVPNHVNHSKLTSNEFSPPPSSQDSGHPPSGWSSGNSNYVNDQNRVNKNRLDNSAMIDNQMAPKRQPPPYQSHYATGQNRQLTAQKSMGNYGTPPAMSHVNYNNYQARISNYALPLNQQPKMNNYQPQVGNNYQPQVGDNYQPQVDNNYQPQVDNNYQPQVDKNYQPQVVNNYQQQSTSNYARMKVLPTNNANQPIISEQSLMV